MGTGLQTTMITDKLTTSGTYYVTHIRLKKCISAIICISLIVYTIIQFYNGIFFSDEFNITEFLINYEGGFVRRGLIGQILFDLCRYTGWSPIYIVKIFCIVIFSIVLSFYFFHFRRHHLNWWILLCPLMFGMCIDVIRKDFLTYLMTICMLYLIGRHKITSSRNIVTLFIIVLGLFIHEAFIFYGIPLVVLFICRYNTNKTLTYISILVTILTFCLIVHYKGNNEIATQIIQSWNNLEAPNAPLITSRNNSVGFLGWDTLYAIKVHTHTNFYCNGFGWYGLIWQPLIMIVTYYFIMNFTAVFSDIRYSDKRRTVISSLAAFNLICLLPMFLFLSCDYGRLYQYVFAVTYAAFLIVPHEKIINLFPSIYINLIVKFNRLLNRIINPTKGMMILFLLFFAISPYDFNPARSIRMSVIYTDFQWIIRMIYDLAVSLI